MIVMKFLSIPSRIIIKEGGPGSESRNRHLSIPSRIIILNETVQEGANLS